MANLQHSNNFQDVFEGRGFFHTINFLWVVEITTIFAKVEEIQNEFANPYCERAASDFWGWPPGEGKIAKGSQRRNASIKQRSTSSNDQTTKREQPGSSC